MERQNSMNKLFYNDAKETCLAINSISGKLANSSILITGGTGMIGVQIVKTLLYLNENQNSNIKIILTIRNDAKLKYLFTKSELENLTIIQHDFSTQKKLPDIDVDYIFHTVAVTGNSKCHVEQPVNTINTALSSMQQLLEFARFHSIKGMIFLSSLEVYGKTDINKYDVSENDYGYLDILNVRSSYSESKRMCETMCVAYAKQYNLPIYIARLTASFGVGTKFEDNRVFAQFARSIVLEKDIVLKSKGDTIRNYCYVSDVVSALFFIMLKGEIGQAYNISNMNTDISIKEMAELIIEQNPTSSSKLIFDIQKDISKLGYNEMLIKRLNSEKLLQLGWKPNVNMQEMLRRLVQYMQVCKDNNEQ